MEDSEKKLLNFILGIGYLFMITGPFLFMKKDMALYLFMMFLLLAIMLEIRNVQERDKAKKKTFNGGKLYNPYRPFTVMSIFFAVLCAIMKILEAAGVIIL